jgi:hypothetical protein
MGLRLLVLHAGRDVLNMLRPAFDAERDPRLRLTTLHVLSLFRDPQLEPLFTSLLSDPDPAIRAGAADAIGILRKPTHAIEVPRDFWVIPPLSVAATIPIDVRDIVDASPLIPVGQTNVGGRQEEYDAAREPLIAVNHGLRDSLEQMMLHAKTRDEREAAARSLVNWPPDDYRLRVAEWGVWIQNGHNLALAKSVLDEIPPFVHRTANYLFTFESYFLHPSFVTKPIMHLTSEQPLAADIEVRIRQGRPWFAYPKPDDFSLATSPSDGDDPNGTEELNRPRGPSMTFPYLGPAHFDNADIDPLDDVSEGYPWLHPMHRAYRSSTTHFGGPAIDGIYSLGLRWQSLILTPAIPEAATLPTVPLDPKYQLWTDLRRVPSSYVTNRGETERFLYYDGPTRAPAPVRVTLSDAGNALSFLQVIAPDAPQPAQGYTDSRRNDFHPLPPQNDLKLPNYDGIYIQVTDGVPAGQRINIDFAHPAHVGAPLPIQGEAAVIAEVRQMLTTYGLTTAESDGLLAAWSGQFFHTDGRRFLLRMSPKDYSQLCPLQVRPAPTRLVRLGLILTEFDKRAEPAIGTPPAPRPAQQLEPY